MLIRKETLDAIAAGRVTLAFRRWRRPTVRAGGALKTAIGVLAIEAVDEVRPDDLAERDAKAAGYAGLEALRSEIKDRPGTLYRIRLRLAGPDPRVALCERDEMPPGEMAALLDRLQRWPWAAAALGLVAANPGIRAADLASLEGLETRTFKGRIRRLKEVGLTESLAVGYRLSPRGRRAFDALRRLS